MIDHLTLTVRDAARTKAFYSAALQPLGYKVLMEFGELFGMGDKAPQFWVKAGEPPTQPMHLAFAARDRRSVDAFHAAARAAGAADNGAPGLRPQYHPHYYGAFVIDPDGHPIEAVCHAPPAAAQAKRAAPKKAAAKKAAAKKAAPKKAAKKAKARKSR